MSTKSGRRLHSRRHVIRSALAIGAASAMPFVISSRSSAQGQRLVARDPGGPFTEAYKVAFYEPFKKETGIEVVGVAGEHEPTAKIRSMVDTKNYEWDIALLSIAAHNILRDAGYIEKHGLEGDSTVKEIPANLQTPYMIGTEVYATALAYRTDHFKTAAPANWNDFFDVKKFPGRRGFRNDPADTCEIALLADGVEPSKLYPLDWNRAFKKLDQIKPHVDVWWTGGAQTSQLLATGEIAVTPAWNGRAQAAIDGGAPVKMGWKQALISYEGWCILRGTPKADLARKFIAFCSDAKRQAAWTPLMTYGPTNPNAFKYIDPKRALDLPTNPTYASELVTVDSEFWGKERQAAVERFKKWMIG